MTDRIGWLEENRDRAEPGLKYFYDKTGVQPHIYLRSTQSGGENRESMNSYAEALYGSLFGDERHLLLLVEETDGRLFYGMAVGKLADAVMDQEAREILEDYWDILLEDSENLGGGQRAAAMGEALERTAANIMMVKQTGGWIWMLVLLVTGILLLAGLEYRKNWKRIQAEEERAGK